MGKEAIIDNGKITLWYYDDYKIVYFKFNGFTYGQELRDGFNKGLEVMKENKAIKWLSDDGETPVLRKEDLEWTSSDWRPRMLEAGWKYWAIVRPEKASAKILFDKFEKVYADLGVTLQLFDDLDSALNWLKEQV